MSSNWKTTVELVLSDRVDIGFADISEAASNPDLETEFARRSELRLLCSAGHPLAGRNDLALEDLLEFPSVGPSAPGRMRSFIPKVSKPCGTFDDANDRFVPRVLFEAFSDAKEIVLSGSGLGVALPLQLQREAAKGLCVFPPIHLPWMSLNCCFIVRRPAPSPAALAFMDIARTIERGVARDGPSRAPDGAPRSAQPKGGEGLAVGAAVEMETAVMGIVGRSSPKGT